MNPLADALRALGLSPETIASIDADLARSDGRSLRHALLIKGIWDNVVDESVTPRPTWIDDWLRLSGSGFPIIDIAALQRLIAAGVDLHDLTGVVRSAQVLTAYNLAQWVDDPAQVLAPYLSSDDAPELPVEVHCSAGDGRQAAPYDLHASLMAHDPAGRHGEPRTLALRQWQMLPDATRDALRDLIGQRRHAHAAALWKKSVGGELSDCLATVQALTHQLPGPPAG